jgi:hypothetical protein
VNNVWLDFVDFTAQSEASWQIVESEIEAELDRRYPVEPLTQRLEHLALANASIQHDPVDLEFGVFLKCKRELG